MRDIFKYNDVTLSNTADGGNTQISLDVIWPYRSNSATAIATLKQSVKSVAVELSLRTVTVTLREVKRLLNQIFWKLIQQALVWIVNPLGVKTK